MSIRKQPAQESKKTLSIQSVKSDINAIINAEIFSTTKLKKLQALSLDVKTHKEFGNTKTWQECMKAIEEAVLDLCPQLSKNEKNLANEILGAHRGQGPHLGQPSSEKDPRFTGENKYGLFGRQASDAGASCRLARIKDRLLIQVGSADTEVSDSWRLDNKVCVVTGANTGIGLETARQLARLGAEVVLACRSQKKADTAAENIRAGYSNAKLHPLGGLDLSSLAKTKSFATALVKKFPTIDVLVNNAGFHQAGRTQTSDGFEKTFEINYLATVQLTESLLPALRRSTQARVVNVLSRQQRSFRLNTAKLDQGSHRLLKSVEGLHAYQRSKLMLGMYTLSLQARALEQNWSVVCFGAHPGPVKTGIFRNTSKLLQHIVGCFSDSVEVGARPSVYCASDPHLANQSVPVFLGKTRRQGLIPFGMEDNNLRRLWEKTNNLLEHWQDKGGFTMKVD